MLEVEPELTVGLGELAVLQPHEELPVFEQRQLLERVGGVREPRLELLQAAPQPGERHTGAREVAQRFRRGGLPEVEVPYAVARIDRPQKPRLHPGPHTPDRNAQHLTQRRRRVQLPDALSVPVQVEGGEELLLRHHDE